MAQQLAVPAANASDTYRDSYWPGVFGLGHLGREPMAEPHPTHEQIVWDFRSKYKPAEQFVVDWFKARAKEEFPEEYAVLTRPRPGPPGKVMYPDMTFLSKRIFAQFKQKGHPPPEISRAKEKIEVVLKYRNEHNDYRRACNEVIDRPHEVWTDILLKMANRINKMQALPKPRATAVSTSASQPANMSRSKLERLKKEALEEMLFSKPQGPPHEPIFARVRRKSASRGDPEAAMESTEEGFKNQLPAEIVPIAEVDEPKRVGVPEETGPATEVDQPKTIDAPEQFFARARQDLSILRVSVPFVIVLELYMLYLLFKLRAEQPR